MSNKLIQAPPPQQGYSTAMEMVQQMPEEQKDYLRFLLGTNDNNSLTDLDLAYVMSRCQAMDLDPFNEEVFVLKDAKTKKVQVKAGYKGLLALANRRPDFLGIKLLYVNPKGTKMDFWPDAELKGGRYPEAIIAVLSKKNTDYKFEAAVSWESVVQKSYNGELKKPWRENPMAMYEKAAVYAVLMRTYGPSFRLEDDERRAEVIAEIQAHQAQSAIDGTSLANPALKGRPTPPPAVVKPAANVPPPPKPAVEVTQSAEEKALRADLKPLMEELQKVNAAEHAKLTENTKAAKLKGISPEVYLKDAINYTRELVEQPPMAEIAVLQALPEDDETLMRQEEWAAIQLEDLLGDLKKVQPEAYQKVLARLEKRKAEGTIDYAAAINHIETLLAYPPVQTVPQNV